MPESKHNGPENLSEHEQGTQYNLVEGSPVDADESANLNSEKVPVSKLNVLVLCQSNETFSGIRQNLVNGGFDSGRIEMAKGGGPALFQLTRRLQTNEKEGHLIIIADDLGGAAFPGLIKENFKEKSPYIVVAKKNRDDEALHDADMEIFLDELSGKVAQIVSSTQNFIARRGGEGVIDSKEEYIQKRKCPWLEGRGFNLLYDTIDENGNVVPEEVVAFDIDGTLAHEFFTDRFVDYLMKDKMFRLLAKSIPPTQSAIDKTMRIIGGKAEENRMETEKKVMRAFEMNPGKDQFEQFGGYKMYLANLITEMFATVRKIKTTNPSEDAYKKFGGYTSFIHLTGYLYSKLLKGLNFEEMLQYGEGFVEEDIKAGEEWANGNNGSDEEAVRERGMFPFTIELIQMCQKMGLNVSLVTGAPREVVEALRKRLGILEICHALESTVNKEGAYTGEVKFNTGMAKVKGKITEMLRKLGHKVIIGMGDSIHADADLVKAGIYPKHNNDVYGGGVFVYADEEGASTGRNITEISQAFETEIRTGRLLTVNRKKLNSQAIIELVRAQIIQIALNEDNKGRLSDTVRKNIIALFSA